MSFTSSEFPGAQLGGRYRKGSPRVVRPSAKNPRLRLHHESTPGEEQGSATADPPPALNAEAVRRAALGAVLPPLSPLALRQLEPPRLASHFKAEELAPYALQDPALLVAIFRAAKASGYVPTKADPAAALLHLNALGLANLLTKVAQSPTRTDPVAHAHLVRGYRHACVAAHVAHGLAPAMKIEPRVAAAAALLHDLGRLTLLAGTLAQRVVGLYDYARNTPLPTAHVEQSGLGISHRQLGAEVAARMGVPDAIAQVCQSHENTEAQWAAMEPAGRALSQLVAACDALAKAHGFCNAESEEVRPLPLAIEPLITQQASEIETLIAEARKKADALWPQAPAVQSPLAGIRLTLTSPRASSTHLLAPALRAMGAEVTLSPWPQPVAEGLLLIDCTGTALSTLMPQLVEIDRRHGKLPRLVLADRCHEPEDRLRTACPTTHVYPTPVRLGNLVSAVRKLSYSPGGVGDVSPVAGSISPAPSEGIVRQASA